MLVVRGSSFCLLFAMAVISLGRALSGYSDVDLLFVAQWVGNGDLHGIVSTMFEAVLDRPVVSELPHSAFYGIKFGFSLAPV